MTKKHDKCHMIWSFIYHSHMWVAKGYWRLLGLSGVFFHPPGMEGGDATPRARVERGRRMGISAESQGRKRQEDGDF